MCDGGCTHTPCRTHIFFALFSLRDIQKRTRMAQGVCSAHVISLHLALSILMFHPPSLLFPHGHFDTSFPSAPSLPNCSRPESAGQAHFRTSGEKFGYLADPTHSTAKLWFNSERNIKNVQDTVRIRRSTTKETDAKANDRKNKVSMGGE